MANLNDTLLAKFKSHVSQSARNGFRNRNQYTEESNSDVDVELAKINVRRFKVPPGQAVAEAARHNANLDPDLESIEVDGEGYGLAFTPNDPSYASQWHLPKVNADDAWEDTQGDPSVVVAVLDTGVQYSHPDLQGRLIRGPSYVSGVSVSDDDHGHGTATTGTVVANINNGVGVSGVAPKCMARVSKILDNTNWGYYSWWSAAIINAADAGVKVINISAGGSSTNSTLQSACTYAYNKGVVIVAAAGNTGNTVPQYPASFPNVVSVSATTSTNTLASFSSRGDPDLAAPGVGILTTAKGGGYQSWSGTSFSSPIVAGAAALVRTINPDLTNTEVITLLKTTAINLGNDASFGSGLVDVDAAVIAAAAATPVEDPPPAPAAPTVSFSSPASGATVSGTVNIVANVTGENLTTIELKVDGVVKLTGIPVLGSVVSIPWISSTVSDGSRTLLLTLSQTGGATATASRTVTVLNATDSTPPTLTVTSPSGNVTVGKKGILKINATATDARSTPTIKTYINGSLEKTVVGTSSTYNWKYFNANVGANTVSVTATDAAGNTSTVNRTVTRTF